MEIRPDRWLADVLGRAAFTLVGAEAAAPGEAGVSVSEHVRRNGPAMYDAKFVADRVDIARELVSVGFYPVDVNVTFAIDGPSAPPAADPAPGVDVRPASEADAPAVLGIAGSCFRYSRFHLDPLIARRDADQVKREWIRSYVEGRRGEALWVAVEGADVVGFLAVMDSHDGATRVRTIDLVGVACSAQRRGVGTSLIRSFVATYSASSGRLEVGTQVANTASLALYERCGFTMRRARTVMHAHLGGTA